MGQQSGQQLTNFEIASNLTGAPLAVVADIPPFEMKTGGAPACDQCAARVLKKGNSNLAPQL
jgi:hypothetical protein